MKNANLALTVLLLAPAVAAGGEEKLLRIDWAAEAPAEAEVVATDRGWSAARFVFAGEGPKVFALSRIEAPGITANRYSVSGEVRYENIEAGSYLEMWNYLPGGGAFFSRTLGLTGPMGQLSGSSDWRPFTLPAFLDDHPERPVALELNLVFAGPGIVEIGPLTLSEPGADENPMAGVAAGWWGARTAGLLGGLGGAGLGILTAILGALVALGRARSVVTILAVLLLVGGFAALALGFVALLANQPYAVYYPLLLVGGLAMFFMLALLFAAPYRYRMLELRRIRAMDAS